MDLKTLLEKSKLELLFPEKLKRQDLFAITKSVDNCQTSEEDLLRFRFINLITHFNGKCRNCAGSFNPYRLGIRAEKIASKSKEYVNSPHIHPIDISTVIFICCDPVARQDLVVHFWGCKHAFPLVVQTENESKPVLFFGPLQAILGQNISHSPYDLIEKPISHYDLKTISILRFHKLEESKSLIFNKIISRSEKVHSFFFHHDCEGSVSKKSAVCKGLIEAAPYFRLETGPAMYLNLRGNVDNYPAQRQYLCRISNILILVCKTDDKKNIKQLVRICHQSQTCQTIIILFTDLGSDSESIVKYSDLETFSVELPIDNHIIPIKNMRRPDMVEQVCSKIDSTFGTIKVLDMLHIAENLNITVDEHNIAAALKKADECSEAILSEYHDNDNTKIFPVQGQCYLEWAKTDKEIHKLRKWNREESVQKYREYLDKLKNECRKKQYQKACNSESKVVVALTNLLTKNNNTKQTEIILRYLNITIQNTTRSNMDKIYSEFKILFDQMKVNDTNENHLSRVTELEEKLDKSALNISGIVREMGQIYEAKCAIKYVENLRKVTKRVIPIEMFQTGVKYLRLNHIGEQLPKAAVQLLLFGFPVEIMDGRSNSVPIDWVKAVFFELQNVLEKDNVSKRVKIISVLGIQSTGKSTLMNIMFGSQFAVGPGRCTRGVYMHLVKVSDDMKNVSDADFFIIIDTEGLYSSYMSFEQIVERDNAERELATFVIGLSNVTIVNIMGENMSYLKDILPIAVHAFLRMDLVGLYPKCRLLHHNVDRNNKLALMEQSKSLLNALDLYTEAACNLEQEQVRRFREIIHFEITQSIDYFPPLFESDSVECVSTAYSREAMILKDTLVKDQSSFTLYELTQHIECLWNAIKTDNFVYEFRNIIETEAQSVLDRHICRMQWKERRQIEDVVTRFNTEVENCKESRKLEQITAEYYKIVDDLITQGVDEYSHMIDNIYATKLLSHAIQKFRVSSIATFKTAMSEYKNSCFSDFRRNIQQKTIEFDILKGERSILLQIDDFIKSQTPASGKGNRPTSKTNEMKSHLFDKCVKEIYSDIDTLKCANFEEDAVNAIYRYFPLHHVKIAKVLRQRPLRNHCLNTFSITDNYWPKHMRCITEHEQDKVKTILQNMSECIDTYLTGIKNWNRFYQADIFKTLVLDVRNHHFIYGGALNNKVNLEIELAVSVCGELIKEIEQLQNDNNVIPDRIMKLAEQYFESKYREAMSTQTSADETVENFAHVLLQESESYILNTLAKELANAFQVDFPFLRSKQGLLCYVLIQLLEEEECLPFYLRRPEYGAECILSALFDTYSGIGNTQSKSKFDIFLEKHVTAILKLLIRKLEDGIEHFKDQRNLHVPVMKTCTDIITSSLDSFLPVSDIRKFEKDCIDEIDPSVVIEKLVKKLNEISVHSYIFKSVKFSVLEKQYETTRCETVDIILSSLIGCQEKCPCCGEICSIGQSNHIGRHKAIMHRPTGFRKILKGSPVDSPSKTCWEEVEPVTNVGTQHYSLIKDLITRWIIPVDVERRNNSFWKYMFATHVTDLASKQNIKETIEIPEPWKELTKTVEMRKMDEFLKNITEQEEQMKS